MLAVLSGGGTAGHINPALALADVLSDRGCDVRFAGTPRGVEARLVPAAGVPFTAFEASGFNRNHPTTIVSGVAKIAKSTKAAKKWFREIGPDVVVGFGGYVSIPVARAAESMGIPVVVHEQNSVMGMANRYLAKSAAAVCVTYEGTADGVCDPRIVHVTGNPVRASVLAARREEGRAMLGIPDEARMLLVFGGSLGARRINEAMTEVLIRSHAEGRLQHIHGTGKSGYDTMAAALAEHGVPLHGDGIDVRAYIDDMPRCMAAADLVISRCGAMTLSELPAAGKPAILIPSPYVAENHQYHNAMVLVEQGAAVCIEEKDLTGDRLWDTVCQLTADPARLKQMAQAMRSAAVLDADERIWQVIRETLGI